MRWWWLGWVKGGLLWVGGCRGCRGGRLWSCGSVCRCCRFLGGVFFIMFWRVIIRMFSCSCRFWNLSLLHLHSLSTIYPISADSAHNHPHTTQTNIKPLPSPTIPKNSTNHKSPHYSYTHSHSQKLK